MTTNDEKDLMRVDDRTQERVIESLVLRGDLSGLAPKDRARFYVQVCEGSGSIPRPTLLRSCASTGRKFSTRRAVRPINSRVSMMVAVVHRSGPQCAGRARPSGADEAPRGERAPPRHAWTEWRHPQPARAQAVAAVPGDAMPSRVPSADRAYVPPRMLFLAWRGGEIPEAPVVAERRAARRPAASRQIATPATIEAARADVWMKPRGSLLQRVPGTAWRPLRPHGGGEMKNARVWLQRGIPVSEDTGGAWSPWSPRHRSASSTCARVHRRAPHRASSPTLAQSARTEIKAASCRRRGMEDPSPTARWRSRLVPGEVKGRSPARSTPPPPDGTDGPTRRAAPRTTPRRPG